MEYVRICMVQNLRFNWLLEDIARIVMIHCKDPSVFLLKEPPCVGLVLQISTVKT